MTETDSVSPLIEAAIAEAKRVAAKIQRKRSGGKWVDPNDLSPEAEIYNRTAILAQNVLEFLQQSTDRLLKTSSRPKTQPRPRPVPRNPSPRS